jgi:hypothetical protein
MKLDVRDPFATGLDRPEALTTPDFGTAPEPDARCGLRGKLEYLLQRARLGTASSLPINRVHLWSELDIFAAS